MGRLDVRRNPTPEAIREFSRAVVRDVEVLEAMLERGMLGTLDAAARRRGARVVLTGILPTLGKSNLGQDSMMPIERYFALNEAVMNAPAAHCM
jgi:hypothetical protein